MVGDGVVVTELRGFTEGVDADCAVGSGDL